MINIKGVENYCKDPINLIENYDEAVNSTEIWDCHHRLETDLGLSREQLIEKDMYLNRPYTELIFLSHSEHTRLHNTGAGNPMYGKPGTMLGKTGSEHPWFNRNHTEETRKKMSESAKNRPPVSDETRKKLSDKAKGRTPWNKGKKMK